MLLEIPAWLSDWVQNSLLNFLSIIPKLVYFIISCMFSLVDLFQVMFRKLVGLDTVMISEEVVTGDPVYTIITDALFSGKYSAVSTAFWSLIILGVFMLLATTLIAVIRTEMVPDKETKNNSKSAIIKNFFKALFNFAIIPVTCIFALFVGNTVIGIIDSALTVNEIVDEEQYSKFEKWTWGDYDGGTLMNEELNKDKSSYIAFNVFGYYIPTTMEPFSSVVFKACAAPCNRISKNKEYLQVLNDNKVLDIFDGTITESEEAADLIDTAFMYNLKLKKEGHLIYNDAINNYCSDYFKELFGQTRIENFSRYNITMVWYFYDLWTFNYIVGFVAIIVILKQYWQFTLSLMARLFELIGLFLISPIPVSLLPLDGGSSLTRWRTKFYIKLALIATIVMGLNLINPLITVVKHIKLFNVPFLDYIILSLFIVAALTALDSINKTIAYILFDKAGSDEYDNSQKMAKAIEGTFGSGFDKVKSAVGIVGGVAKAAGGVAMLGAKAVGGIAQKGVSLGMNATSKGATKAHAAKYNKQERNEIGKAIKYGDEEKKAQKKTFENTSNEDRRSFAERFKETDAGKEMLKNNFKGDEKAMEDAIAKNNFQGRKGAEEMRDKLYEAQYKEELFKKTDEAKSLQEGSKEYNEALTKFMNSTEEEKISQFQNQTTTISPQQEEVRRKLQEQPNIVKNIERVKKIAEGAKKVTEKIKAAGAKTAGAVKGAFKPINEHIINPILKPASNVMSPVSEIPKALTSQPKQK